ncbi:hypothetical protein [Anaerosalibacter massiliensis]|uniref:hypothetical protein n=1 Tax=Anaerosalibacter massiliensis TaxID=1347392 RepID=UPI0005B2DF04|nr:hypothetical protein [Anaerosalibacter massiliensis]
MKRYESFNKMLGGNETAEEQAVGMVTTKIAEEHNLDIDVVDGYVKLFGSYVNWLNEEVKE